MKEPQISYRAFLESKDSLTITSLIAYWTHGRGQLRAVVWHASREEWLYAPGTAAGLLFGDEYIDESLNVDRATAEKMAREYFPADLPSPARLLEMGEEGDRMGWDFGPPPRQ